MSFDISEKASLRGGGTYLALIFMLACSYIYDSVLNGTFVFGLLELG